jgi:outer membrane protein OmpA-like peptidoglycan-associated protein
MKLTAILMTGCLALALLGCQKAVVKPPIAKSAESPKALDAYANATSQKTAPRAPLAAKIEQTVLFDFDDFSIGSEAAQILDEVARVSKGRVLYLTGATCSLGSDSYNYDLGLKRAQAVRSYLESKLVKVGGVKSIGENDPVSLTDLRLNRRVVVRSSKK